MVKNGNQTEANQKEEDRVAWNKLPFLSLLFKNDNELIAGGYDNRPVLFAKTGKKWFVVSARGGCLKTNSESLFFKGP